MFMFVCIKIEDNLFAQNFQIWSKTNFTLHTLVYLCNKFMISYLQKNPHLNQEKCDFKKLYSFYY